MEVYAAGGLGGGGGGVATDGWGLPLRCWVALQADGLNWTDTLSEYLSIKNTIVLCTIVLYKDLLGP